MYIDQNGYGGWIVVFSKKLWKYALFWFRHNKHSPVSVIWNKSWRYFCFQKQHFVCTHVTSQLIEVCFKWPVVLVFRIITWKIGNVFFKFSENFVLKTAGSELRLYTCIYCLHFSGKFILFNASSLLLLKYRRKWHYTRLAPNLVSVVCLSLHT